MKICPNCQGTYPDDYSVCPRDGARLVAQATATETQLAAGLSRRFRIIRRLGAGGMGTVFLAEQIGVGNRPVALKILNRKLLDDPEFMRRFQNEAGSTGCIRHVNVVTIYESAQADDGTPYIAMEFLEGESLFELVKRRGALPVAEVVEITQQVADGLDAAHDLGIIHRDLKPDNIFLRRDKRDRLVVKVMDFGIAKLRDSSTQTQIGMVLGTPAYMSYEQASGMRSDELDARSDIYSLGVVVYEMLSGRAPFHSDTPVGYLRKHLMEDPPPFRAIAQGLSVPPAVESAVMKALAKDRDQRYATVLDFARALASAAQPPLRSEAPVPIPQIQSVQPPAKMPAVRQPIAPIPLAASEQAVADIAVQTPPPTPRARNDEAPIAQPRGGKAALEMSRLPTAAEPPQFATTQEPLRKMRIVVIAVVILILVVAGVWFFLPSDNPRVGKPQGVLGTPQSGTQSTAVESHPPTSKSAVGSGTDAADIRKAVEEAKRQGDNYYDNGDYDKAIDAYRQALKLDPSNAQLLKSLEHAETAKAAEQKFNQ